jgi:hypothetical protein
MSENMEVRNIRGRMRTPQVNNTTFFSLTKDGKSYSRSVNMLYMQVFPEKDHSHIKKAGRPKKVRRNITSVQNAEHERLKMNRFYRIESFPEYGINRKGEVINLGSQDIVTPSARDGLSVHLRKDGQWHYIAVRTLMRRTFGT